MMTSRELSDSALTISSSCRWAIDMSETRVSGRKSTFEPLEQRLDVGAQLLAVDQLQRTAAPRLAADEDVGRDIEILEQVEFLVHEGDAGGDRIRRR